MIVKLCGWLVVWISCLAILLNGWIPFPWDAILFVGGIVSGIFIGRILADIVTSYIHKN